MVRATIFTTLVVLSAHAIYSYPQYAQQGYGGYYQAPQYQNYPMYQAPQPQYQSYPMYQAPQPQYPVYQGPPPYQPQYQPRGRSMAQGGPNGRRRQSPHGAHKIEDKKWNNATNNHYDFQPSFAGFTWMKASYDQDTTQEGNSRTEIKRSEWPY